MESGKRKEIYTPIHALTECEYPDPCPNIVFEKIESEMGEYCVAYCKVLERYLTRSSVRKCVTLWKLCPFAKMSL